MHFGLGSSYKKENKNFFQVLKSRHGKILIIAAIIEAIGRYCLCYCSKIAGSIAIPIATLTPATGAILGRII